jgi:Nif-specific regulatory protein
MENLKDSNNYEIIGKSENIRSILEIAVKVASSEAPVLINGESGTGKELFARFIHNNSRRKDKKFVAINCAAIPAELLENELFGHIKGAYTDATSDYIGKFGYADEGTIFLDEIAEMSINLQAKLLRLIQFLEYQPIGGSVTMKTDVRLIAATNKNLQDLLKQKKFREDLFYRLNVVPLYLPPLRDRDIDIGILAEYFLEIYNRKNKKFIKGFEPDVIGIFKSYEWPGNVRELQNVIERAVILSNYKFITKNDITINIKTDPEETKKVQTLKDALDDFKRSFILESLEANQWNQTKTAQVLKIQRTYLSRLIKELNISKF